MNEEQGSWCRDWHVEMGFSTERARKDLEMNDGNIDALCPGEECTERTSNKKRLILADTKTIGREMAYKLEPSRLGAHNVSSSADDSGYEKRHLSGSTPFRRSRLRQHDGSMDDGITREPRFTHYSVPSLNMVPVTAGETFAPLHPAAAAADQRRRQTVYPGAVAVPGIDASESDGDEYTTTAPASIASLPFAVEARLVQGNEEDVEVLQEELQQRTMELQQQNLELERLRKERENAVVAQVLDTDEKDPPSAINREEQQENSSKRDASNDASKPIISWRKSPRVNSSLAPRLQKETKETKGIIDHAQAFLSSPHESNSSSKLSSNKQVLQETRSVQTKTRASLIRIQQQAADTQMLGEETVKELSNLRHELSTIETESRKLNANLTKTQKLQDTFDRWSLHFGGHKRRAKRESQVATGIRKREKQNKAKNPKSKAQQCAKSARRTKEQSDVLHSVSRNTGKDDSHLEHLDSEDRASLSKIEDEDAEIDTLLDAANDALDQLDFLAKSMNQVDKLLEKAHSKQSVADGRIQRALGIGGTKRTRVARPSYNTE